MTTHATHPYEELLADVLATPADEVDEFARTVVAACVRLEASGDDLGVAAAAILGVAEEHPDDIGLVVLLLMHYRVLQPGDYFGEVALAMHVPRTASVRALTPAVVASCDQATFDELLRPIFADASQDG